MTPNASCRALAASTLLLFASGCGGSEASEPTEADSGSETADAAQGGGSDAGSGAAEDAAPPGPFTLTVVKAGDGKGDVTSSPAGIDCGATCSAPLAAGTSVTLTAKPSVGATFKGWSGGGCSGSGATCTVTMSAAVSVTATFAVEELALTVTKDGKGAGTVTSAPAGIDCGATCSVPFAYGTAVTLTATADATSTFTGWSGGGCSGTGNCTVALTAASGVTATFAPKYQVSVTKDGTGSGTVTSDTGGIACGATCAGLYDENSTVTLTAAPGPNTVFAGWSGGGCSGTGTCKVSVTAAASVNATFTTVVFTTWDPSWSLPGVTYSNGNLAVSGNSPNTKNARTIAGKSSGKWYWEIKATAGDGTTDAGGLGIAEHAMLNSSKWVGGTTSGLGFGYGACCSQQWWLTWSGVTTPAGIPPLSSAVKAGAVYMFALDMDNGRFWTGQDGTWFNGGDPNTNANPAAVGLSGTVYPAITFYENSINAFVGNFGASAFSYPVPAGFNPGLYSIPTTWDPAWSVPGVTYAQGNLAISGNSPNTKNVRTLVGRSLGKYYWELTTTGGDGATDAGGIGILEAAMANDSNYIGWSPSGLGFGYGSCCSVKWWVNWNGVTNPSGLPPANSAVKTGNVYMFALDMNAGKLWTGQNGTWYNAGDPALATNPAATGITGTVYPGATFYASSINAFTANFGGSTFAYPPPSGFGAGFY